MNEDGKSVNGTSRLERLLPLLSGDPDNLALLCDAAEAALAERRPDVAAGLISRAAELAPLAPSQVNLAGLAAMQLSLFDEAAAHFESLATQDIGGSAVRFNLAWCRAMLKDFEGALGLLDENTATDLAQAAMLKVQILHERAEFEQAAELARHYVSQHPDHPGLLAAVSVLALDIGDTELAERCAARAGDHPDALTTLGTLALGEERSADARRLFDRAIERNTGSARAWVGRGLTGLLGDDAAKAGEDIDRGAELFGDHLGSWIAAGWAYFVAGDLALSRRRFETALEIDDTFAEAHGSLAVIDILEGERESGRERSKVALRLDRNCYSAALARVLLAADAGDEMSARRIFELAVNSPVDGKGRTIAQSLARMGLTGSS